VICQACSNLDRLYRIGGAAFQGYNTAGAANSDLNHVTAPPAPLGWNLPSFTPDARWVPAAEVWWNDWSAPGWSPLPQGSRPIGWGDEAGHGVGEDGTTLLYRREFSLTPPNAGWRVTRAFLEMWSDNKTAWWWQGNLVQDNREAYQGTVELFPALVDAQGGNYALAVQNSNDAQGGVNPQGIAYRMCVIWGYGEAAEHQALLPLVLKR
jgi:hypothetical protein